MRCTRCAGALDSRTSGYLALSFLNHHVRAEVGIKLLSEPAIIPAQQRNDAANQQAKGENADSGHARADEMDGEIIEGTKHHDTRTN